MKRAACLSAVAALLALAGCEPAELGLAKTGEACDASGAQFAVGQAADSHLAERARKAAKAKNTRWLKPGDVFFEEDAQRLSLEVDAGNMVVRARCG